MSEALVFMERAYQTHRSNPRILKEYRQINAQVHPKPGVGQLFRLYNGDHGLYVDTSFGAEHATNVTVHLIKIGQKECWSDLFK